MGQSFLNYPLHSEVLRGQLLPKNKMYIKQNKDFCPTPTTLHVELSYKKLIFCNKCEKWFALFYTVPLLHPIPIKVFKKLAGSFIWSLNQVYSFVRTIFVQFIDVYIPLAIQKGTFKTNSSCLMAQATGWTNLVPCTYRRLQKCCCCCCCCWIKEYPLSPVKGSCSMYHQFTNLSIALPCPISSNPHSLNIPTESAL